MTKILLHPSGFWRIDFVINHKFSYWACFITTKKSICYQSSKVRLFSIRRSNSVYKHTVGIRKLFLLFLLFLLNLIPIIVYQTWVSLFILTSPFRELLSVRSSILHTQVVKISNYTDVLYNIMWVAVIQRSQMKIQ
jgi:hypothetical protein